MQPSSQERATEPEPGLAGHAIDTWRYLRLALVAVVIGLFVAVAVERAKVHPGCFLTSISAYYYTPVRDYFVGTLIASAVGMICLRGSTPTEDVLLNLAGMFAALAAFVPTPISTPPPKCSSVPIVKSGLEQGVATNVTALLVVGALGLIVSLALIVRKGQRRTWHESVGWGLAVAIWFATAMVFALARHFFIDTAHYAAAVPMFALIVAVAVDNALDYKRQRPGKSLRNRYMAIAAAMVATAAVVGIAGLLGWRYWTILTEAILIGLFAAFWVTQTVELWKPGLRARSPTPLPTTRRPAA